MVMIDFTTRELFAGVARHRPSALRDVCAQLKTLMTEEAERTHAGGCFDSRSLSLSDCHNILDYASLSQLTKVDAFALLAQEPIFAWEGEEEEEEEEDDDDNDNDDGEGQRDEEGRRGEAESSNDGLEERRRRRDREWGCEWTGEIGDGSENLCLDAVVGIEDPLRHDVREAVMRCQVSNLFYLRPLYFFRYGLFFLFSFFFFLDILCTNIIVCAQSETLNHIGCRYFCSDGHG